MTTAPTPTVSSTVGHALSRVRVHTDSDAAAAAVSLGAAAFTVGHHVYFAPGRYQPDGYAGRRLLAHELGHVVSGERGVLRRYESFEHRNIGDRYLSDLRSFLSGEQGAEWLRAAGFDAAAILAQMDLDPAGPGKTIQVKGDRGTIAMTPGEIIALMGDFYGSVDSLANADRGELGSKFAGANGGGPAGGKPPDGILDIVDREEKRGRSTGQENADYDVITHGRFTRLAQVNEHHFSPGNRATWRKMHEDALALARAAGPGADSDEKFQRALFVDAAAGHFLTDAFAAGHLFNVYEVEEAIRQHLAAHPIRAENPEMQTVLGVLDMAGLAKKIVLKNIHDRMNAEGVDVENARGMKWRTVGDNALRGSVDTQRIAALTVFLSRMQLVEARAGKAVNADDIIAMLPLEENIARATRTAIGYIPEAVRAAPTLISGQLPLLKTLNPPWYLGGPLVPKVLAPSILSNIADPGRPRQLEDLERQSRERGTGPLLAPQFRVFEWK